MSTAQHAKAARQAVSEPLPTTTFAPCTWEGHCLGASCGTNDDCDNDWICVSELCSPCCEVAVPSSLVSATTSKSLPTHPTHTTPSLAPAASATSESHKGLTTASAIGIGVGIVGALAIAVVVALWVWYTRRKSRRTQVSPSESRPTLGPSPYSSSSLPSDRKLLVDTPSHHGIRSELECPAKPMELSSVELVELEGDTSRKEVGRDADVKSIPIRAPEQAASQPWPRYRFEECSVAEGEGLIQSPTNWEPYRPSPSLRHGQDEEGTDYFAYPSPSFLSQTSNNVTQDKHNYEERTRRKSRPGSSSSRNFSRPSYPDQSLRGSQEDLHHSRSEHDSAYTFFGWPDDEDDNHDTLKADRPNAPRPK
ncbi:hypothetical protein EJ04DRAFT_556129 [Polyplosphaeria fusca]|uniref:Uncharacterized protein n=1 Tax=Polyplosphaeria fusca TaxID=682080 RepID=A0A9P4UXZ5_9PLEO|nr:hypothetical protein EJ04DRAFT_556129 [Polyplosphaeria fusca]